MKWLALLTILLLPLAAAAWDEPKEGLWEINLKVHMDDRDFGPYDTRQCITQKDLENPARLFAAAGSCSYSNLHFFANELNFNVSCNLAVPLKGIGHVEYAADWIKGTMDLDAQVPDGPTVETSNVLSAKRLGNCSD